MGLMMYILVEDVINDAHLGGNRMGLMMYILVVNRMGLMMYILVLNRMMLNRIQIIIYLQ